MPGIDSFGIGIEGTSLPPDIYAKNVYNLAGETNPFSTLLFPELSATMLINRFSIPDHKLRSAILVSLIVILSPTLFFDSAAKMAITAEGPGSLVSQMPPLRITPAFIRDYEARMRPFFESRIKGPRAVAALPQTPYSRESDVFLLPRLWSGLSPEFKALYKAATGIPAGFIMYQTPGGYFEVYYTISDTNPSAVDITDTIGYGGGQSWKTKTSGKNGVPDYIDETAWALDSSRSMMVDRFGFIAPLPFKDAQHTSNRYRVIVTKLGADDYGWTWPDEKATSPAKGWTSHIEIRNEWNENFPWAKLGYQQYPENGIRVTCAHELFHGVQYAMSWNSGNDYFPLTWLEGTAVLMEELGFDYINDYLQYAKPFFDNPQMSFFDPSGMRVYTNSLLTKFIFEKGTGPNRIDLIKNVFFNNYNKMTPFHPNLRNTSIGLGSSWVNVLNRFHVGSYYSGARADTSHFLADAALLKEWTWLPDSVSLSHTTVKPVNPYGMSTFNFAPAAGEGNTLSVDLECETSALDSLPYPSWGAAVIIKRLLRPDTLFSPLIDPAGLARFHIVDWRQVQEILMIVTNGHPSAVRKATASLLACPVTYRTGDSIVFRDTVPSVKSLPDDFITVGLVAGSDLTCSLTTSVITPASVPALPKSMMLSGLFALSYPEFWGTSAAVSLTFFVRASYLESLKKRFVVVNDSIGIWRFDNTLSMWKKAQSGPGSAPDGTAWRLSDAPPGIYGLFLSQLSALDTTRMVIAPNPASIRSKKGMYFEGDQIREIRIYSADGSLVCDTHDPRSVAFQRYIGGYVWHLVNNGGATITPGYYTAISIQTLSGKKKSKLSKVLVFP